MDPEPEISIHVMCEAWRRDIAEVETRCRTAVLEALREAKEAGGDVSVVLSDDSHIRTLNGTYRGLDEPTDVLAFEAGESPAGLDTGEGSSRILGDVIVAYETALGAGSRPAAISPADHLSHLVVHGTLHLLGYDHQDDDEARVMEALEVKVLARLGIADPYCEDETVSSVDG